MEVPYDWYAAATAATTPTSTAAAYLPNEYGGRTYPSPAPSIDPSPGPLPHLSLQEPFVHHSRMNMAYNDVGPTRAVARKQFVNDGTGRYTEGQRMDVQPPYHAQTQSPSSSMASPYSPYPPRSLSNYVDDIIRMPSPALSSGSGSGSGSAGSTSGRSPLSAGTTLDLSNHRALSSAIPARRTIQKHTKHRLLAADRKAICLYHMSAKHARQEDIANRFGCERSTVSKILKHKDKWLNISPAIEESPHTAKHRASKFPMVEAELADPYLAKWHNSGTIITDQLIRTTALSIAKELGHSPDEFKASSGWLENFKHRYKIRRGEWLNGQHYNKLRYRSEVAPQSSYPVPAIVPPSLPIQDHVEIFNSSRQAQENSNTTQSSFEGSAQEQTASQSSNQRHENGEVGGESGLDPRLQSQPVASGSQSVQQEVEPMSASEIALLGVPENYGKRMFPLFEPATDPQERFEQLRCPPLDRIHGFHLDQIHNSINILASFFENEGRGVLKPTERRVLEHIRNAVRSLEFDYDYER